MPFIQTIPPKRATGELAQVYKAFAEKFGSNMIANIIQVVSLKPASVTRAARSFELSQWYLSAYYDFMWNHEHGPKLNHLTDLEELHGGHAEEPRRGGGEHRRGIRKQRPYGIVQLLPC